MTRQEAVAILRELHASRALETRHRNALVVAVRELESLLARSEDDTAKMGQGKK